MPRKVSLSGRVDELLNLIGGATPPTAGFLKGELVAIRTSVSALESDAELMEAHEEVERMKAVAQGLHGVIGQELQSMRQTHEAETAAMTQSYKAEAAALAESHKAELRSQADRHEAELVAQKERFESELEKLRSEIQRKQEGQKATERTKPEKTNEEIATRDYVLAQLSRKDPKGCDLDFISVEMGWHRTRAIHYLDVLESEGLALSAPLYDNEEMSSYVTMWYLTKEGRARLEERGLLDFCVGGGDQKAAFQ
jgi:hypothetical protein